MTLTTMQHIFRAFAVACFAGALVLMTVVFLNLLGAIEVAAPAAAQQVAQAVAAHTDLSPLQVLYTMGAGFVLIMGALAGISLWVEARFRDLATRFRELEAMIREVDAKAEARSRESDAKAEARAREAEARAREAEARTDKKFELLHGQIHDIFMILANNKQGRVDHADRAPERQTDSDGQ